MIKQTAFKNRNTLEQALDELFELGESAVDEVAHSIAATIKSLHLDYGAKLELIHTALQHRLFKPSSHLKHFFSLMALRTQHAMNYMFNFSDVYHLPSTTDPRHILATAKQELIKSRNKIILC